MIAKQQMENSERIKKPASIRGGDSQANLHEKIYDTYGEGTGNHIEKSTVTEENAIGRVRRSGKMGDPKGQNCESAINTVLIEDMKCFIQM